MNAQQLDERQTSGLPVAVMSQRYGTPLFRILHRTPQLVTLQATGESMGAAPWLMKLSNIQRMTPGDVARRFLPPGAIITAKPYDVLPAPDKGFTPNEVLASIVRFHQPALTHTVQQAVLVYEHAQAWFRRHIMPTTTGCMVWLTKKQATRFKAKLCHVKSVQGWTAVNNMPNIAGHHLYYLTGTKALRAFLCSEDYRASMMEYAKASGSVNAKA